MYISTKRDVRTLPLDKLLVNYTKALAEATEKASEYVYDNFNSKAEDRELTFRQDILDENIAKAKEAAKKEVVSSFCKYYAVPGGANWIMPQIASIVAEMPLPKTAEGKIDTLEYVKSFGRDDWFKGLWILCTHPLRGDMLQKQYAPENRSYSALVPLLMAPHKRFSNVKYSAWDRTGFDKVLDPNLYEAVSYTEYPNLTKEEILEIQEHSLVVKTGAKAGSTRNPATTHKLYGLTGDLHAMPWLCQVMYFQIWCAHPLNRGDLMILNWKDLDNMPEPLVTVDLFKEEPVKNILNKKNVQITSDLPW